MEEDMGCLVFLMAIGFGATAGGLMDNFLFGLAVFAAIIFFAKIIWNQFGQ